MTSPCGDLAIERHRPLRMDVRALFRQECEIWRVDGACFGFQYANVHGDSSFAESVNAAAGDFGKRVTHRNDNACNGGLDDRVGTRRSLAPMAARLKRDIKSRSPSRWSGRGQCMDLRVGLAELLVPTFTNNSAVAHEDGADQRVRFHKSLPSPRKVQGQLHPVCVVHWKRVFFANLSWPCIVSLNVLRVSFDHQPT